LSPGCNVGVGVSLVGKEELDDDVVGGVDDGVELDEAVCVDDEFSSDWPVEVVAPLDIAQAPPADTSRRVIAAKDISARRLPRIPFLLRAPSVARLPMSLPRVRVDSR
jgi:hypothetical protein